VGWVSEAGAEYYIQVVGDSLGDFGSYTLAIQSVDNITVVPDNNGKHTPSLEGVPTLA
jgi:hypothetical protein